MANTYSEELISEAKKLGISPELVLAIAFVESTYNPWAVRYEPNWKYLYQVKLHARDLNITEDTETHMQMCSWGLLQIMGSVAREMNFHGPLHQLAAPRLNAHYGCAKIQKLLFKYFIEADVVAAYNAGEPKKDKDGRYVNQAYVQLVVDKYNELKKANRRF